MSLKRKSKKRVAVALGKSMGSSKKQKVMEKINCSSNAVVPLEKPGSQIHMGRRRSVRKRNPAVATTSMLEKLVDSQNDSDIYELLPKMEKQGSQVHMGRRRSVKKGNPAIAMPSSILEKLVDPQNDSDIYEHLPKMEVLQLDMKSSKIENLKENSKSSLA